MRLRTTPVQAAWAASHTKNAYRPAAYHRPAGRRGKKRASAALGHTIPVVSCHLLKDQTTYRESGPDSFDKLDPDRQTRGPVRRLEQMGRQATPEPRPPVPAA